MSPVPPLRAGPVDDVDRFELVRTVSAGTEGVIYEARQRIGRTTTTFAVKMLHPGHDAALDHWADRWAEQASLLRHLAAPGLVRVHDTFIAPLPHAADAMDLETRALYLVMDWVEGEPLWRWAQRQTELPADELLLALLPVGAALDLLHSGVATGGQGLVHGDVKPSNILITEAGTVLVDLGSVRAFDSGQRPGAAGSGAYRAPEVVREGLWSAASDRYALGCVVVALLSGTEPPESAGPEDLRAMLDASLRCADTPDLVGHTMEMLDADPAGRPQHCANWLAQLRGSSMVTAPGDYRLPPVYTGRSDAPAGMAVLRAGRQRRWPLVLAGVAASIVLAAGVAVAADRGTDHHGSASALNTGTSSTSSSSSSSSSSSTSSTPAVGPTSGDQGPTTAIGGQSDGEDVIAPKPQVLALALTHGPEGSTTAMRLPGCSGGIAMTTGPSDFADAYDRSSSIGVYDLHIPEDAATGPQQLAFRCDSSNVSYAGTFEVTGHRPFLSPLPFALLGQSITINDLDTCGAELPATPQVGVIVTWASTEGTPTQGPPPDGQAQFWQGQAQADASGTWQPITTPVLPSVAPAGANYLMVQVWCDSPSTNIAQRWETQYAFLYVKLGPPPLPF